MLIRLALACLALALPLAACGGDDAQGGEGRPVTGQAPTQPASRQQATAAPAGAVRTPAQPPVLPIVANLQRAGRELPRELQKGTRLGREDAPVTIEMWEDFQCPFCLRYTSNVEPALVTEFVKTGKVQIVFRQFPVLGRESVLAAVAGLCAAEQNRFWEYHNRLFLVQAENGQDQDEKLNAGRFDTARLKQFATDLGLDRTAFDACYDPGTPIATVQADDRRARELGLRGTPSFVVNGTPLTGSGAPAIADWRRIIEEAQKR